MKTSLLLAAALALATAADAAPYFRPLDFSHPAPVAGVLLAPEAPGQSSGAALLPIFTHSPKDGCLLPSIVCEDWSPLAVGASANAGKMTFDVAPIANVLPWVQSAAAAAVPSDWQGVQRILASSPDHSVTFSAGPVWEYRQRDNKGYFRIFTGLALQF